MSDYYARFLGLKPEVTPGRSSTELDADQLMEDGLFTDAALSYARVISPDSATLARHAACLLWSRAPGDAVALLEPLGDALDPAAQAVLAAALFAWSDGWGNAHREERAAKGWAALSRLLDLDAPPWLAFVTLVGRAHLQPERDPARQAGWFRRAVELYPDDERFWLEVERAEDDGNVEARFSCLKQAFARQPSARLAYRLSLVFTQGEEYGKAAAALGEAERLDAEAPGWGAMATPLRALQVEQLIRNGDGTAALALALTLDPDDGEGLLVHRTQLAAACAAGDEKAVALHGRTFVDTMDDANVDVTEALGEQVVCLQGPGWSGSDYTLAAPELYAHREILLACDDGVVRGWMRYLFAARDLARREVEMEADPESATPVDWTRIADALVDAADLVSSPAVELFDVGVRLHLKGEKWRALGQRWIRARVALQMSGRYAPLSDVGDILAGAPTRAATFFGGIAAGLDAAPPFPDTFDALEEGVGEALTDAKASGAAAVALAIIARTDLRAIVQFRLGYSLHDSRSSADITAALAAYGRALDADPTDPAAIRNALLLCVAPAHAEIVRRMDRLIGDLDKGTLDSEMLQKLADALGAAKRRCMPREAIDSPLARMLADFPPLRTDQPAVESVSLRGAVALVALMRASPADGDLLLLRPMTQGAGVFAPTDAMLNVLFDALGTGLVTLGDPTPSAAVVGSGDKWSCYPKQLWWRLSPSAFGFVAEARAQRPFAQWPSAWKRQALDLAREIAVEECVEYVKHLCEARNWPEPASPERTRELAGEMIQHFSVAQAHYLFYLGAMAASDRQRTYRLSDQHASHTMVKLAGERLGNAVAGKYATVKAFERGWKLARSALSLAFWSDLLDLGDAGFTIPVAEALGRATTSA